jgi:hypothetical protein
MNAHDHHHHHEHPHATPEMPADITAWHRHTDSEGVPREEHAAHANTRALLVTFVVITLGTVIFCLIIGVYTIGQVNRLKTTGEVEGLAVLNAEASQYKRDALASQENYGWTAEGKVRLPIEQAMRMVVEEHKEQASQ